MSARHTPGPWIAVGWQVEILSAGAPDICNTNPETFGQHGRSYEERCANANLIAAAPELLEALKDARRKLAWFTDSYPQDIVVSESEFFEPIDAAIAKAEGA